jgi:hypothetical protein
MSLRARSELAESIRERYSAASRKQKTTILDEFTAATGYTRKHAIAVLSRPGPSTAPRRRRRPRLYTDDVRQALVTVWEASNCLCSKRLVPYLPTFVTALECFGHLELDPETRDCLLEVSAATCSAHRWLPRPTRKRHRRKIQPTGCVPSVNSER